MKSVISEKHEFENRNESISETVLAFVVHQGSNAEKSSFLCQYSLTVESFRLPASWKNSSLKKDEREV